MYLKSSSTRSWTAALSPTALWPGPDGQWLQWGASALATPAEHSHAHSTHVARSHTHSTISLPLCLGHWLTHSGLASFSPLTVPLTLHLCHCLCLTISLLHFSAFVSLALPLLLPLPLTLSLILPLPLPLTRSHWLTFCLCLHLCLCLCLHLCLCTDSISLAHWLRDECTDSVEYSVRVPRALCGTLHVRSGCRRQSAHCLW